MHDFISKIATPTTNHDSFDTFFLSFWWWMSSDFTFKICFFFRKMISLYLPAHYNSIFLKKNELNNG